MLKTDFCKNKFELNLEKYVYTIYGALTRKRLFD